MKNPLKTSIVGSLEGIHKGETSCHVVEEEALEHSIEEEPKHDEDVSFKEIYYGTENILQEEPMYSHEEALLKT